MCILIVSPQTTDQIKQCCNGGLEIMAYCVQWETSSHTIIIEFICMFAVCLREMWWKIRCARERKKKNRGRDREAEVYQKSGTHLMCGKIPITFGGEREPRLHNTSTIQALLHSRVWPIQQGAIKTLRYTKWVHTLYTTPRRDTQIDKY